MGNRITIPDVGFSIGEQFATRPRAVLFVLMFLAFIALQGGAAAETVDLGGQLAGTNGEAAADPGP